MGFVHNFGEDTAGLFVNIDKVISAFTTAQIASGIKPTFEEADPNRKKSSTENNNEEPKKGSGRCGWFAGKFQVGYDEEEEDDNKDYICEYCDRLGYHQKYRPEICDSCHICESCNEYDNNECSGCSFSVYRDGQYYRDKISEDELLSSHDKELLSHLQEDNDYDRYQRHYTILSHRR